MKLLNFPVAQLHSPFAQHIDEQAMVTIPLALTVQRCQEKVVTVQVGQQLLAILSSRDCIAQRTRKLVKHRGCQPESSQVLRLAPPDLIHQVVGHIAVSTAK